MGSEVKGRSSRTIGLIICVILVVLLSISNVWLFNTTQSQISDLETKNSDLQMQIGTLLTENANLQSQISNLKDQLKSQVDSFQSQVDTLQTENNRLQNEIKALEAPQLHKVNVQWADHERFEPYVSIQGSIFNSGLESAHNTILTVRIFDIVDTLLKSEEIHLGTIDGKSYIAFDVDIPYSGDADLVTTTLAYD